MDATAGPALAAGQHHGWPAPRKLITGVLTIVLLAAGVLVAVLISHANVTGANATAPGDPSQSPRPLPTSAQPGSTTPQAPTSSSSGPVHSPQALPAPPGPNTRPETPTIAPAVPGSPQGTPQQLAGAITDYYALVPGNLPAAWDRLTANYQQNHAGGFSGYQNFWNAVGRVTVFNVSATPGDMVDATIDYYFKDGRVIEEQTRYRLVAENGLWKIDSSTVSSSQTK